MNPFDHSECEDHDEIVYPLQISESVGFDLLHVFERLWDLIAMGDLAHALDLLGSVGYLVTQTAMGRGDEVEANYQAHRDLHAMRRAAMDGIDWEDEMRKLLGGNE